MQSGVPVITSSHSAMQEIAGDAALYADPASYQDIGEKMMLLFKDEKLRNQFINKGLERVKQYSWEKTSELLWDTIMKTVRREITIQ